MTKVMSFEVDEANKYGLNESILIEYFWHQCMRVKTGIRHEFNGRTWVRLSRSDIRDAIPFLIDSDVKTAISHLVTINVIRLCNLNKNPNDETVWYSFSNNVDFIKKGFIV